MSEQGTTDLQTGLDKVFIALRGIDIRRRTDDKWIGGVCSGLADRLGVDPVIIRVGLVVLSLFWGFGIVVYLLGWVLLANDKDEIVAERGLQEGDGGSIVLLCLTALALFGGLTWGSGGPTGATALLIVPFVVFVVWVTQSKTRAQGGSRPSQAATEADQKVSSYRAGTGLGAASSATTSGSSPGMYGPAATAAIPKPATTLSTPGAPGPPPATFRPVVPAQPPVPRQPRRRSGGPLMALLAIGLAMATYGSLIWAARELGWTGDHEVIAAAGALGAIGLLLVVLGIAGWRAGFVAFLAVVLAVTVWTSSAIPAGIDIGGRVGDATWAPTSVAADSNYHLGVGEGVLDLSGLPAGGLPGIPTPASPPTIPAYVGLGELRVIVPQDLTVQVVGHVGLGEILLPADTSGSGHDGSDISRSAVIGEGPPDVVVNAGVGIGQLTIVKE
jgi:phage shock protein PspC (stress-responsive transcriptional regulator)